MLRCETRHIFILSNWVTSLKPSNKHKKLHIHTKQTKTYTTKTYYKHDCCTYKEEKTKIGNFRSFYNHQKYEKSKCVCVSILQRVLRQNERITVKLFRSNKRRRSSIYNLLLKSEDERRDFIYLLLVVCMLVANNTRLRRTISATQIIKENHHRHSLRHFLDAYMHVCLTPSTVHDNNVYFLIRSARSDHVRFVSRRHSSFFNQTTKPTKSEKWSNRMNGKVKATLFLDFFHYW